LVDRLRIGYTKVVPILDDAPSSLIEPNRCLSGTYGKHEELLRLPKQ